MSEQETEQESVAEEVAEATEQEPVIECAAPFALASDGYVYMHEDELPADMRHGRKEWRGFRLTPAEMGLFAEEVELVMPNVALSLRCAIQGKTSAPKQPQDPEPVTPEPGPEPSGST
ncbi:hypothetical protein [Polyangium mundeleinium]|uniref:Uncharacterized protein n=1 Tax=Polyangium mundeleinium TaxID=2995306 RepID=A0ABT5EHG6_9BACT|nr:hypothetical protein [Polyangium mundeleinium]MDC0740934.1 hypothetical protein [Polyangium mundeleinium]